MNEKKVPETNVGSEKIKLFSTKRLVVGENYDECGFNVHTTSTGLNDRTFSFLAENSWACAEWIRLISTTALVAKQNAVPLHKKYQVNAFCLPGAFQRKHWSLIVEWQEQARRVIESSSFQKFSALLIVVNFLTNVIQTETLPQAGSYDFRLFQSLDLAFTMVVTRPRSSFLVTHPY